MEDNKNVKIEIQPGETVLFKGKKASVVSVEPDGTYVILQRGMTIECQKSSLESVNKVDVVDKQFKFDKDGALLDECLVMCSIDGMPMFEQAYVNFGEYRRKKNKMKVRVVNECGDLMCTSDKCDITLSEVPMIPQENEEVDIHGVDDGDRDAYVHGVVLGADGDATRKIMINSDSYNAAEDGDEFVDILYIEEEGFKHGKLRKKDISTLSV